MAGDVIAAGCLPYWAASWEAYSAAAFVVASSPASSARALSRYPAESPQKVSVPELSEELFRLWFHLMGTVLLQVVSFLLPVSLPRSYSASPRSSLAVSPALSSHSGSAGSARSQLQVLLSPHQERLLVLVELSRPLWPRPHFLRHSPPAALADLAAARSKCPTLESVPALWCRGISLRSWLPPVLLPADRAAPKEARECSRTSLYPAQPKRRSPPEAPWERCGPHHW